MIGLTDLEVYNSISNLTEENTNLQIYKFPDEKAGCVSYEKVRDETETDLDVSGITDIDLQDDSIGPIIIDENTEQVTKRMEDDKYMLIFAIYVDSFYQNFESFLRTEIDLVEIDVRMVLYEINSSFITYHLQPGFYAFKDLSEVIFNILQLEYPSFSREIAIELDDITRKTILVVKLGIVAIRFDEKSIFSTILGLTSGWEFKHYNDYTSQKIVNSSTTNKIHLKYDVVDGSVVNGLRQSIFYSFVIDKKPGYKVFLEPETIHGWKTSYI